MDTIRKTKTLANAVWNECLPFGAMKCGLLGVVTALSVVSAGNAFAAQDQALLDATHRNQITNDAKNKQVASADTTPKKPSLQLDHGPRAEVTPWVNEQRRLHAKQEGQ